MESVAQVSATPGQITDTIIHFQSQTDKCDEIADKVADKVNKTSQTIHHNKKEIIRHVLSATAQEKRMTEILDSVVSSYKRVYPNKTFGSKEERDTAAILKEALVLQRKGVEMLVEITDEVKKQLC